MIFSLYEFFAAKERNKYFRCLTPSVHLYRPMLLRVGGGGGAEADRSMYCRVRGGVRCRRGCQFMAGLIHTGRQAHFTLTFTPTGNLEFSHLTRMSLDCGRKSEHAEGTHAENVQTSTVTAKQEKQHLSTSWDSSLFLHFFLFCKPNKWWTFLWGIHFSFIDFT